MNNNPYYIEILNNDLIKTYSHNDIFNKSLFTCSSFFIAQNIDTKYFIITKQDSIKGFLIVVIRGSSFFFGHLTKTLWVLSGFHTFDCSNHEQAIIKSLLLKSIAEYGKKQNVIQIRFNHWTRELSSEVFVQEGWVPQLYKTIEINLEQDVNCLVKGMSKGHKSTFKKAEKKGVEIIISRKIEDPCFVDFYNLYLLTYQRAKKTEPNSSMSLHTKDFLYKILSNNEVPCLLAAAYVKNELSAAAILGIIGNSVVYYIGCSNKFLNREYGTSNLIIWKSILWAKENGYLFFDLGGIPTKISDDDPANGVYQFKKGFGGSVVNYYGGTMVFNKWKSAIFDWGLRNRFIFRYLIERLK